MAQLYPTIHNDIDSYGLPVLEVRNNDIYPTIHNEIHSFGLPVYEIRNCIQLFTTM